MAAVATMVGRTGATKRNPEMEMDQTAAMNRGEEDEKTNVVGTAGHPHEKMSAAGTVGNLHDPRAQASSNWIFGPDPFAS